MKKLIECVPNISEGRDEEKIKKISSIVETVPGITLLDVDPGKATNRTVITFVGEPKPIVQAAFLLIQKAQELIDMSKHTGEHPRFGATDVCPFVPVANATMEDCIKCAKELGKRVGEDLQIPVYLYENAASASHRKNLASIRAGEYEGIANKIKQDKWMPDYGPKTFQAKSGNIAIGARDFLIAYNVNLNTTSVKRANSVAFDVREKGRIKTENGKPSGKKILDKEGQPLRTPGTCKGVKAIGWYIEEYGVAQISMNITNVNDTPLHKAFNECVKSAYNRGMRVTGSELVGLVPLKSMLDAGKYFLKKQNKSIGVSKKELLKIAIKSMGLDELDGFDPYNKIIELILEKKSNRPLVNLSLIDFANETASESPAPGGGSIAAYLGVLGASLGTMVANLSANKRGWEDQIATFSEWANKGQIIKDKLLWLVDEDTAAFNKIMAAFQLPKSNENDIKYRDKAIQEATIYAIEVPLQVMETVLESFHLIQEMATIGNPNSSSDAGVAALCARSAAIGAQLNVQINVLDLKDQKKIASYLEKASKLVKLAINKEEEVLDIVWKTIQS